MRDGTFRDSFVDACEHGALTHESTGTTHCNSLEDISARAGGRITSKTITLTASGSPASVDVFTVTGPVVVMGLYGSFVDVTDVADIDALYLDIWDGTTAVEITDSAGVTCDGVTLGAVLAKTLVSTSPITLLDADQVRLNEEASNKAFKPFILNAKNGVTNTIRCHYTSAAGCNAQIDWALEWRCLNAAALGNIVAA